MALDSGMEESVKETKPLNYEEQIKADAKLYVQASEELDNVRRQIRDLTNRVGDMERSAERLKEKLGKTVGSNIRTRNVLVGSKLVRIEYTDMERAPKVTVEDVGS